mgnify:CR=1 FL=1
MKIFLLCRQFLEHKKSFEKVKFENFFQRQPFWDFLENGEKFWEGEF